MAGPIVEGFSLSHAAILDGATGAEHALGNIYGVREGSIAVDTDSYDNTGDNTILSTWNWFNFATVSVQSGYIPFDLISLLTGATILSSGTGNATQYTLPLWNEASLNAIARPMLIRVPSKLSDGTAKTIDFVLFKVQFEPMSFDGPSYKNGMLANYSGKALLSSTSETGTLLSASQATGGLGLAVGERAIGRIVSKP